MKNFIHFVASFSVISILIVFVVTFNNSLKIVTGNDFLSARVMSSGAPSFFGAPSSAVDNPPASSSNVVTPATISPSVPSTPVSSVMNNNSVGVGTVVNNNSNNTGGEQGPRDVLTPLVPMMVWDGSSPPYNQHVNGTVHFEILAQKARATSGPFGIDSPTGVPLDFLQFMVDGKPYGDPLTGSTRYSINLDTTKLSDAYHSVVAHGVSGKYTKDMELDINVNNTNIYVSAPAPKAQIKKLGQTQIQNIGTNNVASLDAIGTLNVFIENGNIYIYGPQTGYIGQSNRIINLYAGSYILYATSRYSQSLCYSGRVTISQNKTTLVRSSGNCNN